jgi:ATP-dependent protease ClpP protease subunit
MKITIHGALDDYDVRPKDVLAQIAATASGEAIDLNIHSPGGDMFGGIAIHNALALHDGPVNVTIDGLAASAASLIAMAGDTITMPENSYLMIHNPWGFVVGDSAVMEEAADLYNRFADTCAAIYAKRSGTEKETVRAMQDATTWLTAEEAKAQGFCTAVIDPVAMTALARLPHALADGLPEPLAAQLVKKQEVAPTSAEPQPGEPTLAQDICELCVIAGKPELAADFIRNGHDLASVRAELLAKVAPQQPTPQQHNPDQPSGVTDALLGAAKTNLTIQTLLAKGEVDRAAAYLQQTKGA